MTRYDDIVPTFRDVSRFSNEGRLAKMVEYLPAESRAKFKPFEDHFRAKSLIHSDPPDHTRLRSLVTTVFNATRVEAMRPRIQAIIDQILDSVQGDGQMDVIRDVAVPLPFGFWAVYWAFPLAINPTLKSGRTDCWPFRESTSPGKRSSNILKKSLIAIKGYMTELIKEKRRQPAEDLLSHLLAAESAGDKLSEQELIYTCITLLVAGHETTTSFIGNGSIRF